MAKTRVRSDGVRVKPEESSGGRRPAARQRTVRRAEASARGKAELEAEARRYRTTLYSIGDAVIATDAAGRVLQMNPVAERLTGWDEAEAKGRPAAEVFRIVNEDTRREVQSPVDRVLREGIVVGLANHTLLVARDGTEWPVADSGAPIRDERGDTAGVVLVFRDQSQERAAQEAIASRERLFRQVFENSTLGKSMTGVDGSLRVNQAFCDLLGYTQEELKGIRWQDITHPDDVQTSAAIVASLLAGERASARYEKRYLHKSGRTVWTDVSTTLQRDGRGRPEFFITSVMDVTARKCAEESLREREAFLQTLTDALPHLVWTCLADGPCDFLSHQWVEYTGISEADQLGFGWLQQLHPDDRDRVVSEWAAAVGNARPFDIEFRIRRADGAYRWFQTRAIPMRDGAGRIVKWYGSNTDIDDIRRAGQEVLAHRKRLEALVQERTAELRRSEESLAKETTVVSEIVAEMLRGELSDAEVERQVLNACLDATHSSHGMIGMINAHGRYDVVAYGGRTLQDCAFSDSAARELSTGMEIRGIWGWPILHGKPLRCNQLSGHPDSVGCPHGHVPIDCFLGVPVLRDGKVIGMVAVANKPSGYSEADERRLARLVDVMVVSRKYRELLTEMEERVGERTAQLEELNKELESFSYSVSHDLRAPLRAIDGFTRILVDDYGRVLDDEGKRVCSVVRDNTVRMGHLIDDLLAFSRLGRTALQLFEIDMETMARSVFHEIANADARARTDFRVGVLPRVVADPSLMRQVWANLLDNAVKFTSKRERAVIEVTGESDGEEAVYAVRDNGAGFDMRYRDKLFGVFQRLHSTKEFEGTGVGLALVQRIVRKHGGRTWAEGEVDRGATFRFAVPGKGP